MGERLLRTQIDAVPKPLVTLNCVEEVELSKSKLVRALDLLALHLFLRQKVEYFLLLKLNVGIKYQVVRILSGQKRLRDQEYLNK